MPVRPGRRRCPIGRFEPNSCGRSGRARSCGSGPGIAGHRTPDAPRVSSGRGQRRPVRRPRDQRPWPCRPDPVRPRDRAGRLVALRLREHDLQLRGRVGRHRAVPQRPVRRARRRRAAGRRGGDQRGHQRAGVADPRRVLRPRRPADAVPARLHRAVHRRDVLHRRLHAAARRDPLHHRELRLSGRAHLLRRDAQDRVVPGHARPPVGHRHGDRLLRHDRRRPAHPRARRAGRGQVPTGRRALSRVRDPDLPRRP